MDDAATVLVQSPTFRDLEMFPSTKFSDYSRQKKEMLCWTRRGIDGHPGLPGPCETGGRVKSPSGGPLFWT